MTQILEGVIAPHSEKPHVFPEATYDVTVRNTCAFSTFIFAEGRYLWPFSRRLFHHAFFNSDLHSGVSPSLELKIPFSSLYRE